MVLSPPTILRPWIQIPSTPSVLFSLCIIEKNKKRPGSARLKNTLLAVCSEAVDSKLVKLETGHTAILRQWLVFSYLMHAAA